jgi:hypothetical protein
MHRFNDGKPFHGSDAVYRGKLTGATNSDHFYFFCPNCGGSQVLQILDFTVISDGPVKYDPANRRGAKRDFKMAFQLRCHKCGLTDFVKISNWGICCGELKHSPSFEGRKAPF